MKNRHPRFRWQLLAALVIGISFRLTAAVPVDWNVAVLNQLLAGVTSNQTLVRVSDMDIPVNYLQNWRDQLAGGIEPQLAFAGSFTAWTSGNVYYAFDASVTPANQKVFLDSAAEWSTFANLHFIARTSQANYILVTNNAALDGGLSAVGMAGGMQLLQIGPTAWDHSVICHELGHALGLVHEHQRSDRDSYVTINTNNIISGHLADFVLLTSSQNKTAYDFLSVMHYRRNAFSVSTVSNTIVPLAAYTKYLNLMGQQFDPLLSTNDRAGMIAIYGAGPGATNVVTNTQDSGPGSLRAALYYANDHPGTTISFNIPTSDAGYSNQVFNILPSDVLPNLVNATTLDGSTEPTNSNPSGPEILLNGALCFTPSVYASGLNIRGAHNTIRSFTINNFPQFAVWINGTNATGNTVSGCYLGIDPTGSVAVTNEYNPLQIDGGAQGNLIGGTNATARNVIGGSVYQGIVLRDAGTCYNVIQGNYIGLNAAGTAALPNAWSGIELFSGAQSNLIGGFSAAARNIISGNTYQGVLLSDTGTSGNVIAGNYIGLTPTGTAALANGWSGVDIDTGSASNTVVSNVISGNLQHGVFIRASTGNIVAGNILGANASGTAAVANGWAGAFAYGGASGNQFFSNIISGNLNQGLIIQSSTGNVVSGNFIGVNAAGTTALPNGWAGVQLASGAQSNLIGGPVTSARNIISGNGEQGILLLNTDAVQNVIQGNYIGLNVVGNTAISNGWSGIEFSQGPNHNQIGGLGGARNYISGNGNYGISINNSSSGNIIQGNTLGLNGTNGAALPNAYAALVFFAGAQSNLVGGVSVGAANLIASSVSDGLEVFDVASTNNTIRGNSIYGNAGRAIALYNSANASLAAPVLSSAVVATNTIVTGTYTGTSGALYTLDFYADATPASSAQSATYLGSKTITGTGAAAAFTANLGTLLPVGRAVTAAATDAVGNTSQLSTGVAISMTSTPNDGIPNAWRAFYFGGTGTTTNSSSYAAGDPDHDGLSNYQEFLTGTNPTNAASVFKLTATTPVSVTNAVILNSVSGIVYRIWARSDLTGSAWELLADQVQGNGTNVVLGDPAAATAAKRFYRAQVLW